MRVHRARVVIRREHVRGRRHARRRQRQRSRLDRLQRPEPEMRRPARRPRRAARRATAARPRTPNPSACAAAPRPGCITSGLNYPHRRCPSSPASSPADPGRPAQVEARWTRGPLRAARRSAPPPPTARSPRCTTAARPSHDGLAARLAGFDAQDGGLRMDLQPMRWSLRLVREDASASLATLCVVRDADGRWLAGRRAPWVASWAGRWALGAGGAVEVGEDPTSTLTRELAEEWSVEPERQTVEALVCLPNRMIMLVGQAWLAPGTEVERDPEHDAHAWWPRDVGEWPGRGRPRAAPHGEAARLVITFDRLKYLSFAHSGVYLTLLVLAIADHPAKTVFGWAHGIGWIVISLLCVVRRAPPGDPAVARDHGRRRGRPRAVRRERRIHRARTPSTQTGTAAGTRYGLRRDMAVNTTVEVVMPAMGESVSDGTVLEWHKQEGDEVSEDETLVEISTDKVDAEVPSPLSGTVVKIHAAEGDTVDVGAVLAEIAPNGSNGGAPRRRARGPPRRRPSPRRRPRSRRSTSRCPPWASRSPRARSSSGPRPSATASRSTRRSSRSPPTRSTPRCPSPAVRHASRRSSPRPATTVEVGQVLARMTAGAGAPQAGHAGARAHLRAAPRRRRRRAVPDGAKITPVAAARRRRPRRRPQRRQGQRPRRPHLQGRRAGRRQRRTTAATAASPPARPAAQGRRRDARALHGRVALDPDRDLLPHDHRHHARRPPQAAQGGRPARLLHPPDRLRDRARGHGADARDGPLVRRDRRQAARHRRRAGQPRHRRRRGEEGRRAHADGPGDPRRRPAHVPAVPRRLQRA